LQCVRPIASKIAGRPAQQRAMSIKEDRAPKSEALGGGNIFTGTMKVIKEYGASDVWRQMRQCKEAKVGTLVGTDELGNRYYENKNEQFGRDRWVVYNTSDIQMDYDPAAVSAQWHGWLHHSTDRVPEDLKKTHGDVIFDAPQTYSKAKMTGRDVTYNNPGKLMGGKVRGDGYTSKSGSVRPPFQKWDPNAGVP